MLRFNAPKLKLSEKFLKIFSLYSDVDTPYINYIFYMIFSKGGGVLSAQRTPFKGQLGAWGSWNNKR